MQLLKQSTAASTLVGPILDSTGANYASAVIGDLNITKNGTSAAMAAAASLTHDHNGYYVLLFTTGNTDTLGRLDVSVNKAGYAMPQKELEVLAAAAFDTLVTNGTLASTTSGRTIVTDASGLVDANAVKVGPTGSGTAQTARDLGASVLLSSGTGTGQISLSSGAVLLQATQTGVTIPTVTTVTNQLTAAQVATGVWQDTTAGDFTAANSVGKSVMNGVTLGTGLTVAAVSGAVGSVTGAVGSVTGAVGSVTGNVGGNVTGSVGSVAAGGITASSFAAAAITATVAPNLDAAITSRMATYTQPTGFLAATFPTGTVANTTNVTAGTITTVTNLTNAPTAGDFTAAMKTSIGTAVAASAVASVTGSVGSVAVGGITSASFAADAVSAAAVSAAAANKVADHGHRRTQANVFASSDGDTPDKLSLYGLIQGTRHFTVSGTTMTVLNTDGTTLGTFTLIGSPGADPIGGIS